MRFKVLLLAVFVGGLSASLAVAAPPPGKGKGGKGQTTGTQVTAGKGRPARLGESCRPRVSLILRGVVVSVASDSLVVDVRRANKHGRALAGKQVTIGVRAATKIRRFGKADLSDLEESDLVKVQVRACKSQDAGKMTLLARRIVARPAVASGTPEVSPPATTTTADTTETP